jgi:hypothetical protein
MSIKIEARLADLLRAGDQLAVPLSTLHRALAEETDGPRISGRLLRECIARRPDLFRLIEPRSTPWNTSHWPAGDREAYDAALKLAGLVPEPAVALAAPRPTPDDEAPPATRLVRRLDATLLELWGDGSAEVTESEAFTEAMLEAQSLRAMIRRTLASGG